MMKICFPVQTDEGLESIVYNHFGSAPTFVVVDTKAKEVHTVDNGNLHHDHGSCSPIQALGGESVDVLVVGGIGGGALMKLNAMGVKVFEAGARTIKDNVMLLAEGKLNEMSLEFSCKAHGGGGDCSH
jgi:predicted Fe-Mo cluster-binding NifX family protein